MSTETELLRASMRGDATAFEVIVRKYQSVVCAITFSATTNLDKSEELAHEAFIRAWTNLAQLEDLAKFRAWLCTIARNVVRNYIRDKKRDVVGRAASLDKMTEISSGKSEPVEAAIDKEQQAVIRRALEQMPEGYREPLILFYREQKSLKQVAEQLELSEEAARTRVSRGRKLLRSQVAAMVEDVIGRTGPGKAFTAGVVASIAGMAIKGSGVATAVTVGAAASGTGATAAIKTLLGSLTGKIVATAAVAAIGGGTVVTFSHLDKPTPKQEISEPQDTVVVQEQERQQPVQEVVDEPDERIASLEAVEDPAETLQSEEHAGLSAPTVSDDNRGFEFVPMGVLRGVFTDANSLQPIKGVTVHIYCADHGERHRAQSDANGVYSFGSINRDGLYRITLETNDYITSEEWRSPRDGDVQLAQGTQFVKHYQLQKGCKLKIRAVDEQGKPIRNVGFYAAYVSDDMGRGPKRSVRSDKEGSAVLGGLKPTEYMLTASHNDYALTGRKIVFKGAFEIQDVIFEMQEGFSIEGKAICSDGLAASGWTISAEPVWWHSIYHRRGHPIGENGHFVLHHVLPGDHEVGIDIPKDGGSSGLWSTSITLPPDRGFLELNIPKPSPHNRVSISGRLAFVGGQYERGTWVTARSEGGHFGTVYIERGQEDFSIDDLVPDLYTVDFSITGVDRQNRTFRNIAAPSEGIVFEIPVRRQARLRARVVDKETGAPITKFELASAGGNNWRQISDPNGQFDISVRGLEAERVTIRAEGYAAKTSQEIHPDANKPTVIELGIGGAIEGTVVDEQSRPIEGAQISFRYRRTRDEDPDGKFATQTDNRGRFLIGDIPDSVTWKWFVIDHPDYAPEIRLIGVEEGHISEARIVLREGGTLEGYVYDAQGRRVADATLYFMAENHYGYWKENRARLGSVTTDSNGFYRVTNMPEKLCFGFRYKPDEHLGVASTAVLPKNGKTTRLDFGGSWRTTGRLLEYGKPMANIKVTMRGNAPGRATAFTAYAMTDFDGRFTFWGIPSGRRSVCWSIPGAYGSQQWVEMGRFEVESEVDSHLGEFDMSLSEVSVVVIAEDPDERLDQLALYLERYSEKEFWGPKAGQLLPRQDVDSPYVFSKLNSGAHEIVARRKDCPTIRKVFHLDRQQPTKRIDLWIPAGSASLSGKVITDDPRQLKSQLRLRSIDQHVTVDFRPTADGSYAIDNLPAGDYIIGGASVALSRQSNFKEFSLESGEHKNLNVKISDAGSSDGGYIVVLVVTEEGLPLAGTDVWLERAGEVIHPHFDSDTSKSFRGMPGECVLYAKCPGYGTVERKVTIKSKDGLNTQQILAPMVVTMAKE